MCLHACVCVLFIEALLLAALFLICSLGFNYLGLLFSYCHKENLTVIALDKNTVSILQYLSGWNNSPLKKSMFNPWNLWLCQVTWQRIMTVTDEIHLANEQTSVSVIWIIQVGPMQSQEYLKVKEGIRRETRWQHELASMSLSTEAGARNHEPR